MRDIFVAICAISSLSAATQAQDRGERRFEVASIKRHVDDGTSTAGITDGPASVRIANLPLRTLIRMAYGVLDAQLEAPGWIGSAVRDVVAKPPAGYESRQLPELLRTLLTERFALVVHREKRDVQGYALRTLPAGHLLPPGTARAFLTARAGLISGKGRTIAELVPLLAQQIGAPVVDETSLAGAFDLKLEWTPLSTSAVAGDISIFTALHEQMGLRLDPIRVSAEAVIVDSVARMPSEN